MSYAGGEADILTRLRAMSAWNTNNSSRENWLILNNGTASSYAVIRAGEHGNLTDFASIGAITRFHGWTSVIEVWQKFGTPGTDIATLEGLVDDIINELWKYPYLGDGEGSGQALVDIRGSEMQERWLNDGAMKWAVWEVTIDWQEEKTISPAE